MVPDASIWQDRAPGWSPSVLSSSGVAENRQTNAPLRGIWQWNADELMVPTHEPIQHLQRRPPPVNNVVVNHR